MWKFYSIFLMGMVALGAAVPKLPKKITKHYSFVPSGWTILDNDTLSLQAFYMKNLEISNAEYREYLKVLEQNGDTAALRLATPDHENWVRQFKSPAMRDMYFSHKTFDHFPVVNVSYFGAMGYCNFLTEKINTTILRKSGVKIRVRLPFHGEIIRAGVGDDYLRKYPWKENGLSNAKGQLRANFASSVVNESTKTASEAHVNDRDYFASAKSYWPNAFGFYNLSGNAAEMTNVPGVAVGGSFQDTEDKITLQSKYIFEGTDCTVGFRVVFTWRQE